MTDNVDMHENPPQPQSSSRSGSQFLLWLVFLLLFCLAATFAFVCSHLEKQDKALTQQMVQIRQQASDDAAKVLGLAHSVEQMQQASAHVEQDITALYMQLNAVNEQIDNLLLPPYPLQPSAQPFVVDETGMSWWQIGLSRTWQALQKIIIVRNNGNKMMPLIAPEESHFLYQNLHAQMQNAIWAVLHHNPTVYQTSLNNVSRWVQQYFVQQAPATISILQALTALQAVNIESQPSNNTGA